MALALVASAETSRCAEMKSQKGQGVGRGLLATARLISSHFPARVKGAPPLARVEVDGVDLVASFTVRHQSDGQWYYNAVALHDAKEKAQDSYGRPDQQAGSSVAPIAGLSGFIRRPLAQINPEAVSRVVDPDTGGNEGGDRCCGVPPRFGHRLARPRPAPKGGDSSTA